MRQARTGGVDPDVTIVMATLDGARWLPGQLASIAAQRRVRWQLVVSDDGSQDTTPALVAAFASGRAVRLIAGPGRGAAQNFLCSLCGPAVAPGYIALADQDDLWLPGKLARALRCLAAVPREVPALYAAESFWIDAGGRCIGRSAAPRRAPSFVAALVENLASGHTIVLNPAALALVRRAGIPPAIGYHDWWLYQLVTGAGGRVILDPRAVACYRRHDGNALGPRRGPRAALRRLAALADGRWREARAAHLDALAAVSDLLTPDARQVLAEARAAATAGLTTRIAHALRQAQARDRRRDRLAFGFAALLGRF